VGAATDGELKMGHDGRLTGLAQAWGVLTKKSLRLLSMSPNSR